MDEGALARERAFLGALILRPEAILWTAARRPPWSFLEPRGIDVMRALVCLARGKHPVTADAVVGALEAHDALVRVGGRAFVESLLDARAALEEARARLVETFVPVEKEAIVVFARRLFEAP